jgi:CRISPR-associated protein Cmx8
MTKSCKITLNYKLSQLPTAAHRAGLAGLLLLINHLSLEEDAAEQHIQVIEFDQCGAIIELNKNGLQALVDLAFQGKYVEKRSKNKIKDAIRTESIEENNKPVTYYYWNALFLTGDALKKRDESDDQVWTALWSEWILNTVRAFPKSREPFKVRAEGQSIPIDKLWAALQKPNGKVGLSSSSLIGAEAQTAEGVSLEDTNAQQFLLNFWPYVSQPYIPCRFSVDGKREDWGYAAAIPDVLNLKSFVEFLPDWLEVRSRKKLGYRPAGALIELPEESALDSLRLMHERLKRQDIVVQAEYEVLGFEVCHAYRADPQRGPELRSIAYLQANQETIGIVDQYAQYREHLYCSWFRRHLLQNLLRGLQWTERWGELFSIAGAEWFDDRYFARDCQIIFKSALGQGDRIVETSELVKIVKSLCDRYLTARLKEKDRDHKFGSDDRHKLARQEFLFVRACANAEDFQKYFFGTLCSQVSPISIPSKGEKLTEEFKTNQLVEISQEILHNTETVRGLTMLALASNFKLSESSQDKSAETSAA